MSESWSDHGRVPYKLSFSHFLSLVEHIGNIQPRKANPNSVPTNTSTSDKVKSTFRRWKESITEPISAGHTKIVFRLLFPEQDARRTYDMQEARVSEALSDVLQIPQGTERLSTWNTSNPSAGKSATGCLGDEVRRAVFGRSTNVPGEELSLIEMDNLLDELAALSPFSASSVRRKHPRPRSRKEILSDLYGTLTPQGVACMTQIILKDIRPLLYPLPSSRTASALLHFNAHALHELTIHEAMHLWDPRMLKVYKIRATIDEAADALDDLNAGALPADIYCPKFGVPIEIPKCLKGQGCTNVIETLQNGSQFDSAWAETKYDGERMQIYLDRTRSPDDQIRIISKSKRDSTLDRIASHSIVQASLGLPITAFVHDELLVDRSRSGASGVKVQRNVILEAELVCYNESEKRIDEFWRIRSLLESTAHGARSRFHAARLKALEGHDESHEGQNDIHHDSLESNAADGGRRHFMLVFFDVLCLDDASLLKKPYEYRRKILERIIKPIQGFNMLAQRVQIKLGERDSVEQLRSIMAQRIAEFEEGLVIKPACSKYNELVTNMRWIKLKKDYIPGLGDTLDLVVVGACWDKDRGRELRVGPETFTTFFIGAVDKALERNRASRGKVHVVVLFSCSYGLSRQQLEEFNWDIRNRKHHEYNIRNVDNLSYTLEIDKSVYLKPSVVFSEPALLEVSGAGFTKSAGAKHYELRFPRITKIWNPRERSWFDGVDLEDFHRIACAAVGRDPPRKRTSDAMKRVWDLPTSPGVRCPEQQVQVTQDWSMRLASVDGRRETSTRKRLSRAATWASVTPSPTPLRVLAPLSNLRSPVLAPKLLTFGKHEGMQCAGEENRVGDPTASTPLRVSPPARLPATPSPTPPPPPPPVSVSPLKRSASEADSGDRHVVVVPSVLRKRKSDGPGDATSNATLPMPAKRVKMEVVSPPPTVMSHRRDAVIPSLESLLSFSRFSGAPEAPDAVRPTQPMAPNTGTPTNWSLDRSLFFIQPSTNPTDNNTDAIKFSLGASRYASQRLSTLDALLWGLGWQTNDRGSGGGDRIMAESVDRGFIFAEVREVQGVVGRLEARRSVRGEEKPVFVFELGDLGWFYKGGGAVGCVSPVWASGGFGR